MEKPREQQANHGSARSGEQARQGQPGNYAPVGGKGGRRPDATPSADERVPRVAFEDAVTEPSSATLARRAARVPRRAAKDDDIDIMSRRRSLFSKDEI